MIFQLFYSHKCKACQELINVIVNEGIMRMFVPICLDYMNQSDIIRMNFKYVPTIIVIGDNQQSTVYEGPEKCGPWINTLIQRRRSQIKQYAETQRKNVQKINNMITSGNSNAPALEYIADEMEGVTDGYAFVATDLYQPKNFVPIGQEKNFNLLTPQDNEKKIGHHEMDSHLSELSMTRDRDNVVMQKTMEQNQLNAIMTTHANDLK